MTRSIDHRTCHEHDHRRPTVAHPHVAVVARPSGEGDGSSLVFPELVEGEYELYEKCGPSVRLRVAIRGGEVTEPTGRAEAYLVTDRAGGVLVGRLVQLLTRRRPRWR